jgi:uncharacterized iron-regulated membrane protein
MGRTVTRAVLRRLHRWIGLTLALPLMLQAMTGLILAADPFVASIEGAPAAIGPLTAPSNLRNIDATAVLAAAQAIVPPDQLPSRWRMLPDAIVAIDFTPPNQRQPVSQVGVDVVSDQVLWARENPDQIYRWVHALHETLLLGLPGRSVVGGVGVGLLLLGVTGIPLWWPPRRHWKTGFTVTPNSRGWWFQRELHGAAGIWMVLLLLMQSISGIALAFPQTARAIAGLPAASPRGARPAGGPRLDPAQAIAAGIAAAEAEFPHAAVQDLRLPGIADRPMVALLQFDGDHQGSPRATVTMDAASARVLSTQDPRNGPTGLAVLDWLHALHDGGAAGPAGRVLTCLFALALPLFPITGLAMWTIRTRRRRATADTVPAGQ